ncbi:alpha/beta hydrolase [Ruegeria arenilitoris]|uniref:alpha/beta hydrolase n=2 Tax=Ruegeria arenilitoris TaxID=1173585 RepID=UPI003463A850
MWFLRFHNYSSGPLQSGRISGNGDFRFPACCRQNQVLLAVCFDKQIFEPERADNLPENLVQSSELITATPVTFRHKLLEYVVRAFARAPMPVLKIIAGKPVEVEGKRLDPLMQIICQKFAPDPQNPPTLEEKRKDLDIRGAWLAHRLDSNVSIKTLTVPGPGDDIKCELHCPTGLPSSARAIIHFHGGGHVMGSPQSHRRTSNRMAKDTQSIVVVPDYRLAPENPFPAAIEDCLAVFDFVAENHQELGIDPNKIALAGGSAGGNLAAVVANHRRSAPIPPCLQILWYPNTERSTARQSFATLGSGFLLDLNEIQEFNDAYTPNPKNLLNPLATPASDDLAGVCPAIILAAGFDPYLDDNLAYAERLRQAGANVEMRVYASLIHGFTGMSELSQGAREAWTDTMVLINKALN